MLHDRNLYKLSEHKIHFVKMLHDISPNSHFSQYAAFVELLQGIATPSLAKS